jgi:branched-chain amino acid transport system substrate-binding protein
LPLIAFPAASITRTYVPAGIEAAKGAVSSAVLIDPSDPDQQANPDVQAYIQWMDKYYPGADKLDGLHTTAFFEGALTVEALKRCGREVSRKCVMQQATTLKDLKVPMLRPGITVGTTPQNYHLFKKLQMLTFDGRRLIPTGVPIAAE